MHVILNWPFVAFLLIGFGYSWCWGFVSSIEIYIWSYGHFKQITRLDNVRILCESCKQAEPARMANKSSELTTHKGRGISLYKYVQVLKSEALNLPKACTTTSGSTPSWARVFQGMRTWSTKEHTIPGYCMVFPYHLAVHAMIELVIISGDSSHFQTPKSHPFPDIPMTGWP